MFSCCELYGELAQLGEHLPCTQGVKGSSPLFSTRTKWSKEVPRKPNNVYQTNTEEKRNRDNILSESLRLAKGDIYDFNRENQKLFIEKINNESTQRVCTLQVK